MASGALSFKSSVRFAPTRAQWRSRLAAGGSQVPSAANSSARRHASCSTSSARPPASRNTAVCLKRASKSCSSAAASGKASTIGSVASPSSPESRKITTMGGKVAPAPGLAPPPGDPAARKRGEPFPADALRAGDLAPLGAPPCLARSQTWSNTPSTGRSRLMICPATRSSIPRSSPTNPSSSNLRQTKSFTSRIVGSPSSNGLCVPGTAPRMNSSCVGALLSTRRSSRAGGSGATSAQSCAYTAARARASPLLLSTGGDTRAGESAGESAEKSLAVGKCGAGFKSGAARPAASMASSARTFASSICPTSACAHAAASAPSSRRAAAATSVWPVRAERADASRADERAHTSRPPSRANWRAAAGEERVRGRSSSIARESARPAGAEEGEP
mmetsp:Transcript_34551/g.86180  ORF Transcript_34551/g.86180 Transcript_34551/m.86180 type:complete len:390 (+) Transcript_34551:1158-2327(+)